METLFVIIFVGIIKLLTYLWPVIITILMVIVLVGFFLGVKGFLTGKNRSVFPDAKETYLRDIYEEVTKRKKKTKEGEVK